MHVNMRKQHCMCCKAVKFMMKLSYSGHIQHGYLRKHIYGGVFCNYGHLWKHISCKFQCEVILLQVVGRFSYLRNEKETLLHLSVECVCVSMRLLYVYVCVKATENV